MQITVREFVEQGNTAKAGETVYIDTAWGYQEVGHVRWPETDPWVVCPKENAGFGISYAVCMSDTLRVERLDRTVDMCGGTVR